MTQSTKEKGNLNRPLPIKEIKCVVKSLSTNKTPGPDTSTDEYNQTFIF